MKKLTLLLFIPIICGCAGLPSTKIQVPTKYGLFTIDSPKDTSWTNVVLRFDPDGTVAATIGSVSSHNDANVIAAMGLANAQQTGQVTDLLGKIIQSPAGQAALKGAGAP